MANERHGFSKAREALFACLSLTIGSGDLSAVGDEPRPILLDHRI
jgi:hypothetical protein